MSKSQDYPPEPARWSRKDPASYYHGQGYESPSKLGARMQADANEARERNNHRTARALEEASDQLSARKGDRWSAAEAKKFVPQGYKNLADKSKRKK